MARGRVSISAICCVRCQKPLMGEIESLIVELKTVHKKLQTDGDRIQRDIAEHADLSQQVMQLTKIISDSVKKLPGRSR